VLLQQRAKEYSGMPNYTGGNLLRDRPRARRLPETSGSGWRFASLPAGDIETPRASPANFGNARIAVTANLGLASAVPVPGL